MAEKIIYTDSDHSLWFSYQIAMEQKPGAVVADLAIYISNNADYEDRVIRAAAGLERAGVVHNVLQRRALPIFSDPVYDSTTNNIIKITVPKASSREGQLGALAELLEKINDAGGITLDIEAAKQAVKTAYAEQSPSSAADRATASRPGNSPTRA